ncbi:hypothetical protein EYC84_007739 [Monilinia fructicola]|uniref:Uncharacterized protein n=1 Tax=Monilinia fructicola TaxID=38448 RepID=A0A5M9JH47_MONFR|nr:hypothetical protein EYC84_007739 [Monilinia fructicola]
MDPSLAQSRHSFQPQPAFTFNPNNKFRRDCPPRSFPSTSTMNSSEMPMKQEPIGLATIHETGFSYCMPEQNNYSLPAWDSSTMPMQPMHDGLPQSYAVHQDFYSPESVGEREPHQNHVMPVSGKAFSDFDFTDHWNTKICDDGMEMQSLDTEMHMGQAYTTDEAVPILDLRCGSGMDSRATNSDYPPASNRNSLMSSTQLSPVASPRMTPQSRPELRLTRMDSNRNKRWSTGSYGTAPSRRPSPFVYHQGHESFPPPHPPHMSSRHSSPTITNPHLPLNMTNLQTQQHPFMMASKHSLQSE